MCCALRTEFVVAFGAAVQALIACVLAFRSASEGLSRLVRIDDWPFSRRDNRMQTAARDITGREVLELIHSEFTFRDRNSGVEFDGVIEEFDAVGGTVRVRRLSPDRPESDAEPGDVSDAEPEHMQLDDVDWKPRENKWSVPFVPTIRAPTPNHLTSVEMTELTWLR